MTKQPNSQNVPEENVKAEITTKRFVTCPGCKKYLHCVDHLFDGTEHSFKGWPCRGEGCRTAISGTVHADGTITRSMRDTRPHSFLLLKLRDLYLVSKEMLEYDAADDTDDYFYHSHQCPTNLLGDVVAVYGPCGEPDQHGMIRYVARIEDTSETRKIFEGGGSLSLRLLLDLFGTDGEPIASNYPEANEGLIPWLAEMRREEAKKSALVTEGPIPDNVNGAAPVQRDRKLRVLLDAARELAAVTGLGPQLERIALEALGTAALAWTVDECPICGRRGDHEWEELTYDERISHVAEAAAQGRYT